MSGRSGKVCGKWTWFVLQYFDLFVRLNTCFVLKVYPKMVVKQNKVMKAKGLNNFCEWTRTWLNGVLKTRILHQHRIG